MLYTAGRLPDNVMELSVLLAYRRRVKTSNAIASTRQPNPPFSFGFGIL